MKRHVFVALVALLTCGLAWWGGKAAYREGDRLERFAAGVPTEDVVWIVKPPGERPVMNTLPGNPFEMVGGELVPIDPDRKRAAQEAKTYFALSQWAYRAVWLAPLAGLLVIGWRRSKREGE